MMRSAASIRGAVRLGFECMDGIVGIVEQMHGTIAGKASSTSRAGVLTEGGVYADIREISGLLRRGTDAAIGLLGKRAPSTGSRAPAAISILNGICGDHLQATQNPLAIPMTLHSAAGRLELTREGLRSGLPHATARIAVFVHGLCLSERSWSRGRGPSIGEKLREQLGHTPVYVRYNTGRHISVNGRELADQLELLIRAWPVPVESLTVLGHSMGGLVLRSACFYASEARSAWVQALENVVCLGTPHHGAPLEKGGHLLTSAMEALPYLQPLALGRHRSGGIKDLRHGSLLDEDWQGSEDGSGSGAPSPVPLLRQVKYYLIAAMGDLFVHPNSAMRLRVPPENCRVFTGMNHFDLLDHSEVHRQLLDWLRASTPRVRS